MWTKERNRQLETTASVLQSIKRDNSGSRYLVDKLMMLHMSFVHCIYVKRVKIDT